MKKTYLKLILGSLLIGIISTSAQVEVLSNQQAERISKQRNYNPEETKWFVKKATTTGVNLNPVIQPDLKIPASLYSTATNLDFELQNFSGWAGNYTTSNCTSPTPNVRNSAGFNFTALNVTTDGHGIVNTGNDPSVTNGVLPAVCPYSGAASARLGDVLDGCSAADISQSFTVTPGDTTLVLYFALVMYDGHPAYDGPKFIFTVKTASGSLVDSAYYDPVNGLSHGFLQVDSVNSLLLYRPWDSLSVSLSQFVGQGITLSLITSDCNGGAHRGYAYVDFKYSGSQSSASIGELSSKSLSIHPNPASTIIWLGSEALGNYVISDIFGNSVKQLSIAGEGPVDITDLPNGIYFISPLGPRLSMAKKFIINR